MTKRRKKSPKKSNATILAHRKFRWLEQLAADPHMSLPALRACIVISAHSSLDHNGSAILGQDTIARKLSGWRQRINEGLRLAAALGHLEIIRRGRDHANAYRMVLKDEASAADDVGKNPTSNPSMMSGNPDIKPDYDVRKSGRRCPESRTDSPFFSPGAPSEPPGRKGEREKNAYAFNSSPGGGPPPADAGTPAEELARGEAPPSEGTFTPTDAVADGEKEQDPSFDDLRARWDRGHPSDNTPGAIARAREAYRKACQEVAPEDLLAAADAWVAAADARRFLPRLTDWLAARAWEKPPPTKKPHGGRGAGPRRNGKANLAETCFELAEEYEQAERRAAS